MHLKDEKKNMITTLILLLKNINRINIPSPRIPKINVKEKIGPVLNQEKLNAVCEELRTYELELERKCKEAIKK